MPKTKDPTVDKAYHLLAPHLSRIDAFVKGRLTEDSDHIIATWIPSHDCSKLSWGECLSRAYGSHAKLAVEPLLIRGVSSEQKKQRDLNSRLKNVGNAFSVGSSSEVADATVILFDDIATTQASEEAATDELYANGARQVVRIVYGRRPSRIEIQDPSDNSTASF